MKVVALLLLLPYLAFGSKFKETFTVKENSRVGPIAEGPMYSADSGVVVTGTPFVEFDGTVALTGEDAANLTIWHTSTIGLFDWGKQDVKFALCDRALGVVQHPVLYSFGNLESVKTYLVEGTQPVNMQFKSPVKNTGYQYIVFALCRDRHKRADSTITGDLGPVEVLVDGVISFRNPYGFLPGRFYGFLPFLGILSIIYLIVMLVFSYLCLVHRHTMLRMQWGIWIVVIMGFVETTTWFMTYVVLNDSGDTTCCPWRTDISFAMFAKNLKQTVSGLLVLAVALGWGVVRPSLTRRTTILVLLLGFFYLAFAVKFDLVRMERISHTDKTDENGVTSNGESAFWAFPVALCDVVFILWIYIALNDTCQELVDDHQNEKLRMYEKLKGTLRLWGILWVLFTIFDLLTRTRVIPWPWTLEFALFGFWDVLYLGVLLRIVVVWRPTETSDRLAYSAQLPTDNVLDEFESQDFEMHSTAQEQRMFENVSGSGLAKA